MASLVAVGALWRFVVERLWERRYALRLAVSLASVVVAARSTAPTDPRSHGVPWR
jgi:hypothetical protein